MYLKIVLSFLLLLPCCWSFAQQDPILMTVNGKKISRSEFEYKLKKDGQDNLKGKDLKTYAAQYAIDQLKVCAAENAGLDTLQSFRNLISTYRKQLIRTYLFGTNTDDTDARNLYSKLRSESGSGEVQIIQIFKHLKQNATSTEIESSKRQMDSIYGVIQAHPDRFNQLVKRFSEKKDTMWIAHLDIPEEFERPVFALSVNHYTEPFFSPSGIHIVKLLGRRNIAPYEQLKDELKNRADSEKDMESLFDKIKSELKYSPNESGMEELLNTGTTAKDLFSIGQKSYSAKEFKRFADVCPMEINAQIKAFISKSLLDSESKKLEKSHPEYYQQIKCYRDDILIREENDISIPAHPDSLSLQDYFLKNQMDYKWSTPHYRGTVLHCANKKIGKIAKKMFKKHPQEEWASIVNTINKNGNNLSIEQGTYAPGDNLAVDFYIYDKEGYVQPAAYPYTLVIGDKLKAPTNYKEVADKLLPDYRNYMQQQWTEHLQAVGKVEISEEVLKTVNNH